MTAPIRLRFVLVTLLGLVAAGPAAAVEPINFADFARLGFAWDLLDPARIVVSVVDTGVMLNEGGDLYDLDGAGPGPALALANTGATDVDTWPATNSVFLNVPGQGVKIYDFTVPTAPVEIQTIPVSSAAVGVGAVVDLGQGSIRYVTAGPSLVFSFVLGAPDASPTDFFTGTLPAPPRDLVGIQGDIYVATAAGLYHGDGAGGSYTVTLVEATDTADVAVNEDGSILSAAQGPAGTGIFTMSVDGTPVRTATSSVNSVATDVKNAEVFIADGTFTYCLDATDPNDPIQTLVLRTDGAITISSDGTNLRAGSDTHVQRSTLGPTAPPPVVEYSFLLPNQVDSDLNQPGVVFTANDVVIESFDVSDPLNPASLGFLPFFSGIVDFLVQNGRGYATVSGEGLKVIDVTDPTDLVLIGFLSAITGTLDVTPNGDCAMIVDGFDVHLVDMTDESAPGLRGSFTFDGPVIDLVLFDDQAVVYHETAVTVVDITDKDLLTEVNRYTGLGAILAMEIAIENEVLLRRSGEVSRVDVATGNEISKITVPIGDEGALEGVEEVVLKASNETYYLTDTTGTLFVLDWSDAANPQVVGEVSRPFFAPKLLTVTANTLVVFEDIGPGQLSIYPAHAATPTSVPGVSPVPASTLFRSIYPNPMGDRTHILLDLPSAGPTALAVYDLRGRKVRDVFRGNLDAGPQLLSWDGRDQRGVNVAAGRYLVRARAAGQTSTRPVLLVR